MRVYVLPADAFGCGHYRLIWPSHVCQSLGINLTIMPPNENSGFEVKVARHSDGKEQLLEAKLPDDADVIVLQRPAHPLQPQLIDLMRQNGITVVVDMDDDMGSIHPENVAFQMYRHRSDSPFSWRWANECCKKATMVTTSTAQLQKVYAKHGRGVVLDNYVPKAYLDFMKMDTYTFGWAGTLKSHPNDPQVMRPAVQRLIDHGHMFAVVGDGRGVKEALALKEKPLASGSTGMSTWATTIAESMDVGLAPLASTMFNTGKSRLKAIEYMSLGIAWVGSPRAEYRRLQREAGCGFLADTPREWFDYVEALMTDDVLRKEQAEAGKVYMESQTYEKNGWRWAEAWEHAMKIQKGSK